MKKVFLDTNMVLDWVLERDENGSGDTPVPVFSLRKPAENYGEFQRRQECRRSCAGNRMGALPY